MDITPKRVRIVSDGTGCGTLVYDEAGKMLHFCKGAEWSCEAGGVAHVTLKMVYPKIDVWGKVARFKNRFRKPLKTYITIEDLIEIDRMKQAANG